MLHTSIAYQVDSGEACSCGEDLGLETWHLFRNTGVCQPGMVPDVEYPSDDSVIPKRVSPTRKVSIIFIIYIFRQLIFILTKLLKLFFLFITG